MKVNLLVAVVSIFSLYLFVSCNEDKSEKVSGDSMSVPKSEKTGSSFSREKHETLSLGTQFRVSGINYEVNGYNTVKATHYSSETENKKMYFGDIVIPSNVEYKSNNFNVVQIGEYAFSGSDSLKSVVVSEGIREISPRAFYGCSMLENISLPSSIEYVGDNVFEGTSWYDSQPDGEIYLGKVLYKYKGTVPECTEVQVKEGTRVIAGNAFLEQDGLVSVMINEGVVSIGGSAFGWCKNLASVGMPNSVRHIFSSAFSFCGSLENVKLPENLITLDAMAFSNCENLKVVMIPPKLREIGLSSFAECRGLETLDIPSNIEIIRSNAFWGCKSLVSLNIEEGVREIEKEAFMECSKLKDIIIPQSINMMGDRVFENTEWLANQPDGLIRIGNIIYNYRGPMEYNKEIKIEEGIKGIAGRAFYDCSNLKSVDLPNSLETIGEEAFFNCGLSSIIIPPSLKKVGFMAFYGCESLLSVKISDLEAWCNIDFCAREANPIHQFGNLYLNDSLITDLVIPDSITKIKDFAFVYGLCLNSVTIPGHVISIGLSAFEECRALGILKISEGVEKISDSAFKNCMNLSKVSIPSSVKIVGFSAFEKCYKLSDLTINEGVMEILNMAFDGCSELTKVTIPSTVNRLGHRAFANCMGLREVVCLNANPPEADDSFLFETEPDFVYGLVSLKVPKGSLKKYKNAKDWKRFGHIIEIN